MCIILRLHAARSSFEAVGEDISQDKLEWNLRVYLAGQKQAFATAAMLLPLPLGIAHSLNRHILFLRPDLESHM